MPWIDAATLTQGNAAPTTRRRPHKCVINNRPRRRLQPSRGVTDCVGVDVTEATPACAAPSAKYPHGRTGTTAGSTAHRRRGEEPCSPCREADRARRRTRDMQCRVEGVSPGVLVCADPTRKYPEGRTGTAAGYLTHMRYGDTPCQPCRSGHAAAQHARYLSNRKRFNDEHRLWRYGITFAQFTELLAAQDGCCAICRTTEPGGRGNFHIDHDHACCPGIRSCGKCIRGLLCASCNVGLGNFQDSPDRMVAAAAYLMSRKGAGADAVH